MASVFIQMGHVPRTRGSTGTAGEQDHCRAVAPIAADLLRRHGHNPIVRGADDPVTRTDLFVALHCDGSTSPKAGGASVGYRNSNGQRAGQAWKVAYQRRGWRFGFRGDNYTTALARYYGTGRALSAGTRYAFIVEHGFLTNPTERSWLTSPQGHAAAGWAILDTVQALFGGTSTTREWDEMASRDEVKLAAREGVLDAPNFQLDRGTGPLHQFLTELGMVVRQTRDAVNQLNERVAALERR